MRFSCYNNVILSWRAIFKGASRWIRYFRYVFRLDRRMADIFAMHLCRGGRCGGTNETGVHRPVHRVGRDSIKQWKHSLCSPLDWRWQCINQEDDCTHRTREYIERRGGTTGPRGQESTVSRVASGATKRPRCIVGDSVTGILPSTLSPCHCTRSRYALRCGFTLSSSLPSFGHGYTSYTPRHCEI